MLIERTTSNSTARRPRNREVTSRYKNSTITNTSAASLSSSYRFPTPSGERTTINVTDLPSPRRFQSAERRRPSPSRIIDTKLCNDGLSSSSSSDLSASNGSSAHHINKLPLTRGFSPSLHCDLPPPSIPPKRIHSVNRSKDNNHQNIDHTLRPSSNTAHRKLILEHRTTPSRLEDSDQTENSQPLDNINRPESRRWTANGKMFGAALSRSVDFSAERLKLPSKMTPMIVQPKLGYGSSRAPRPMNSSRAFPQTASESQNACGGFLQQKGNAESKDVKEDLSAKVSRKLQESVQNSSRFPPTEHQQVDQMESLLSMHADTSLDLTDRSISSSIPDNISETESMPSIITTATTSSSKGMPASSAGRSVRGTTVPARFLQDASVRSTRSSQTMNSLRSSMAEPDLAMASARRGGMKSNTPPMTPDQILPVSDIVVNGVALSPWVGPINRSLPPQQQSLSLSRLSPYRNSTSPSKVRTLLPMPLLTHNHHHQRSSNAAVSLNFGVVETSKRSGKKGLSQMEEAHQYRMLQNRLLQWRFVNAKAEAAMEAQICAAEVIAVSTSTNMCFSNLFCVPF